MAKTRRFRFPYQGVATDSTSERSIPAMGWMTAEEWGKVGFDVEMRGRTGLIELAIGYETCNLEDSPDAHVVITAWRNANGLTFKAGMTDTTSNTQPKQLVRPVFIVKLTSGSTLSTCCAGGVMYLLDP